MNINDIIIVLGWVFVVVFPLASILIVSGKSLVDLIVKSWSDDHKIDGEEWKLILAETNRFVRALARFFKLFE